ncbi:1-acyl-sn-glycerol-3-phosphate acyltransferase [Tsukamurella tyrosinosolvens]|uniref:lysophospholipid acyltransferase family protein n=1 Tax=Tsukamurella tyrosinosolvens TaxID=57704 RepID=UPI000793B216|nr:lysophospholipid acyltransferase family protein [Tsukamurella tyrosinosolvens]AUN41609.1 1-acyl-sn-glycerol-3-phosphate acyltransferase [Tsukamurella tyrosinosolvens]KXP06995.1 glycerol acyltransferase [Tsukamurella tyrosinosolvens]KZL98196.1 glycerol acyltransferase [Tsukamurella tyrosinosolvens]MCA4994346.1 1-acyl-sn-glycerol-3-phosphate acyltransferase [Tsukamurella tyrosinosolvens]MEC4611890.1 lysophospholipid acyltransferase family protein [Tsukamurella tyrosinosolvens]
MSLSSLRAAFRYRVARHLLIGPALWAWGRPEYTGLENIPRSGPVILAANHLAISDSFYVVQSARRPVSFLAKADYFTEPGLKGKFKKVFFSGMGQIPVDRRGGSVSAPALEAATKIVEDGGAWGIHPEGTRSPDGRLYKGKTGAVRVALATGTPIIPIALGRTDNRTRKNFWKSRVTVDVLPPLDLSDASLDDQESIRRATDRLMDVIGEHTGQTRVPEYAKKGGK